MIETLYKPFQKWSEKGSVWIISDTHFDDEDCKFMDENWISPERHIENIKRYVHKNDTLIHLGDVGNPVYLSDLKCYKVLIMGNHDAGKSNYERKLRKFEYNFPTIEDAQKALKNGDISYFNWIKCINRAIGWIDNYLFDEVYTGPLMISDKLILSHEPLDIDWAFNIHGHDHNKVEKLAHIENHLNLASNVVGYVPFNLGVAIKEGLLKDIKSIHRQTIDNASRKKILKNTVVNF